MSATALVAALAGSVGAAWLVCRLLKRFADGDGSVPLVPRTPSVRFVAQPGFPGPDTWLATYPPASLGEHPETAPVPGPLGDGAADVEDLLTGAIRHLRANADQAR